MWKLEALVDNFNEPFCEPSFQALQGVPLLPRGPRPPLPQGLLQRRPADRVQADVQGGLRLGALAEEVLQAEHAQVEGEDDIYTGPLYFYRIQRDRIPVQ